MRYLDSHTGTHVYDDDTDQWHRFEDEETARRFLQFEDEFQPEGIIDADRPSPVPVYILEQGDKDEVEQSRGAADIGTFNVPIASAQPFEIIPVDYKRREVRLKFVSTAGNVMVGHKNQVMVGQGYIMTTGDRETFETTTALWAAGVAPGPWTAATLSVLVVTNRP